jgi:hypothetical protein
LGKTERYPPPKFSTCVHLFPTLQFMAISWNPFVSAPKLFWNKVL